MKKHDENSKVEMLEGAKSIGAGAATIALAGAAVGIGNVLLILILVCVLCFGPIRMENCPKHKPFHGQASSSSGDKERDKDKVPVPDYTLLLEVKRKKTIKNLREMHKKAFPSERGPTTAQWKAAISRVLGPESLEEQYRALTQLDGELHYNFFYLREAGDCPRFQQLLELARPLKSK